MDLDWRYERKFAIEQMSLNEAENILLCNNMFFSEAYYKRQVNNIYFQSLFILCLGGIFGSHFTIGILNEFKKKY